MERNYKKKFYWRVIENIKHSCRKFDIHLVIKNWWTNLFGLYRQHQLGGKKIEFTIWFKKFRCCAASASVYLFIAAIVGVVADSVRSNSATSCVNWCDLMRKFTAIEQLTTANNYLLSDKLITLCVCVCVRLSVSKFVCTLCLAAHLNIDSDRLYKTVIHIRIRFFCMLVAQAFDDLLEITWVLFTLTAWKCLLFFRTIFNIFRLKSESSFFRAKKKRIAIVLRLMELSIKRDQNLRLFVFCIVGDM